MAYCIGFIFILWLMTKTTKKTVKADNLEYVTCDELDELICRVDELEERLKEVEG